MASEHRTGRKAGETGATQAQPDHRAASVARSPRRTDPPVTYASIRLDDDQLERLADLIAERLGRNARREPLVDARRARAPSRREPLSATTMRARLARSELGPAKEDAFGSTPRWRYEPADSRWSPQRRRPFRRDPVGGGCLNPTGRARHPFLERTAVWDDETGLWRDGEGYPTRDECWRSTGLGTQGLVAQGPNDAPGATHNEWEPTRREWRKERRGSKTKPIARAMSADGPRSTCGA